MVTMTVAQQERIQLGLMARNSHHNAAVVTDSGRINEIKPICKLLAGEGFGVDLVHTDDLLTNRNALHNYQMVLLDVSKFDGIGAHTCNQLRHQNENIPIVVLSDDNSIADRIKGFENGADDFICKPFVPNELSLRLRALMRRSSSAKPNNVLRYDDLTLDMTSRTVQRGQYSVDLSRREFALLSYFVQHAEQALNRESILSHVWEHHSEHQSNVVDVYVNYLRNKIEQPGSAKLIHTVRGKGYMLHNRWA